VKKKPELMTENAYQVYTDLQMKINSKTELQLTGSDKTEMQTGDVSLDPTVLTISALSLELRLMGIGITYLTVTSFQHQLSQSNLGCSEFVKTLQGSILEKFLKEATPFCHVEVDLKKTLISMKEVLEMKRFVSIKEYFLMLRNIKLKNLLSEVTITMANIIVTRKEVLLNMQQLIKEIECFGVYLDSVIIGLL
jgi:hypothetical protein